MCEYVSVSGSMWASVACVEIYRHIWGIWEYVDIYESICEDVGEYDRHIYVYI